MYGYTGKLLRVDLSSGRSQAEPIPEPIMKSFLRTPGQPPVRLCPIWISPLMSITMPLATHARAFPHHSDSGI